jgi:hypothetical protein
MPGVSRKKRMSGPTPGCCPMKQVRDRAYVLHHPVVGELTLHGELIALPDEPSCWGLDLFAAEPGSPSEQALWILGSM